MQCETIEHIKIVEYLLLMQQLHHHYTYNFEHESNRLTGKYQFTLIDR